MRILRLHGPSRGCLHSSPRAPQRGSNATQPRTQWTDPIRAAITQKDDEPHKIDNTRSGFEILGFFKPVLAGPHRQPLRTTPATHPPRMTGQETNTASNSQRAKARSTSSFATQKTHGNVEQRPQHNLTSRSSDNLTTRSPDPCIAFSLCCRDCSGGQRLLC